MSAENQKIKPKSDIEFFLNNANQCVWKKLNNDSGAGANAASRVDMTFAATDPLSEIVWCPDKGLSLKCADSSFADKNSSLFRDVGKSCMILARPQNFTSVSSTTDKPIYDDFVKPIAVVRAKSDIAEADARTMHPTGDAGVKAECKAYEEDDIGSVGNKEKMNTTVTASNLPNDQNENLMSNWEKITGDQADIGTDKLSGIEGNKFSAISGQADQRPFDNLLLQSDKNKPSMDQNPYPGRHSDGGIDIGLEKKAVVTDDDLHTVVEPIIEYKGSGAPGTNLTSSGRSPLEKPESSAENDLLTFNCEAAYAGTSGVNVKEIEHKFQDNEMMLPSDKILPVLHSPCHSRIHMAIYKGKEKSLSDRDANVILSREENDSHSSVESCNSAGFFSTGKKRRNFQQQLIIGSKRVKKKIEETSGSKSYVKQDSSFMNWISNMVKGLSQSIQNDSNTLALTLANPNHHNLRPDKKLITCKMNQDPESKSTGFKSIFQSIYCPSLKNVGARMSHQEGKSSEDLEPGNIEHGIDATPITCCAENNSLSKLCLASNKFEVSTGRHDAGPTSKPKIKPLNFFNCQESSKNNPVETKNYSILGHSKDKEEVASHSSSTKQNTDNNDNVYSNALSDRKEEENICPKRDNLGSLWITRFSPKFTVPLREQPANDTEASTDLKADKGNNDHKSKFEHLSSSPGFRNLEPMASMFARRFGAIKHIIPTNTADNTTQVNMLCLFCGTRGHQLSDCLAISESMLEDLQKNIDSYGGLEEHPCLCIKCFQPNHWAILCPTSISTRIHELKADALVNDRGKHFIPSSEESARLLTGEDDRVLSGGSINDETDHRAGQNINLKQKSNEIITLVGCNESFKKYCGSSSEENKFRENPITSPSKLAERKISHVPKEIFDAVKKLRLSRIDILKWINTHGSISQLDGFFLRLRLGKWEEGLGGTGYHVAYINEAQSQRQCSEQNTKKSLSVKVGSIKCMVESQYISNHDFLEEEMMEWWSTTSEAGAEVPSEEDLLKKIEKKKMLGL